MKSFAEKSAKLKNAFLDPTIGSFLKKEAPGKRILDIGCGYVQVIGATKHLSMVLRSLMVLINN